jgi:biopolymer transport protein ExbB
MNLIQQGGVMMWPLVLLSVPALGIILERFIFFISHPFPGAADRRPPETSEDPDLFTPFFDSLTPKIPAAQKEESVALASKEILFRFGQRLDFLASVSTTAPLLGLLGTVVGMVQAFSKIAGTQGGMDISLLADGIWHALLTTAAGLVIAIPSLMAHQWFCSRTRNTAFEMERYANRIINRSGTRDHD